MEKVRICGYMPGAIGRVTELHARYYNEHWDFGLYFESKVAEEMCQFLKRFREETDGFWIATRDENIVGSVAIDGIDAKTEGAHLRWFIVAPGHQGLGIGNALLRKASSFCRSAKFKRVYLWTFAGLDSARHLYEKFGFRICKEQDGKQWGMTVKEQMFELLL